MTEAPTPTEKEKKKQRDNTKNATKNFDYMYSVFTLCWCGDGWIN